MQKYNLTTQINMKPFGEKHLKYFLNCMKNTMNISEGAYRAGKTVANVLAFAMLLETHPDKIHLASGATISNAKLNIGDCNGLGLQHIFRGRCKWGKYLDNDCLRINTAVGERIVIFVGGGLSDSYKRIQGNSYGMWIGTELPNHYIGNEPEKNFIDMALSRLAQSSRRYVFWDLNPTFTRHPIYTQYIDEYVEKNKKHQYEGGVNYQTFSIFDNNALSKKQIKLTLNDYLVNSVQYRRYILGERACAEGLVFLQFSAQPNKWIEEESFINTIDKHITSIGIDFGGNGSATAFVCSLISRDFKNIVVIQDKRINMSSGTVDSNRIKEEFKGFMHELWDLLGRNNCGTRVDYIFGDSAEQVLIQEIRNAIREMGVSIPVFNCQKKTIKLRIDLKNKMINSETWHVLKNCKNVINSTATQVYDSRIGHDDERLDNGTIDIDSADAEEYSWSYWLSNIAQKQ